MIHFKCWMKSILECPICPPKAPRFASVPLDEGTMRKRKRKSRDSAITKNVGDDRLSPMDDDGSLSAAMSYVENLGTNFGMDVPTVDSRATPSIEANQVALGVVDCLSDLQCGDWIVYQSPVSLIEISNCIELKFASNAAF